MRIPGIKTIACAPAGSMPADIEMKALAGLTPDITGIAFTAIGFIGEPICEVESGNEENGNVHHIRLSFFIQNSISYRRHVWIVTKQTGENMLIGSRQSIPKFTCRDVSAGPGTANRAEVTVELDSCCSIINVGDVRPTATDDGYIRFEDWRQVADARYAQKVHTHPATEVDDENFSKTQDEINEELYDTAAAGIVL